MSSPDSLLLSRNETRNETPRAEQRREGAVDPRLGVGSRLEGPAPPRLGVDSRREGPGDVRPESGTSEGCFRVDGLPLTVRVDVREEGQA